MTDIFWKVLVHQSRVKIISIFNPQNMKEFSIPKNEDLTLEKEKKICKFKNDSTGKTSRSRIFKNVREAGNRYEIGHS